MIKFIKGLAIETYLLLKTYPLLRRINKKRNEYTQQDIHNAINNFCKDSLKLNGQKIIIHGEENIPDEASLYVSNHRSMVDGVILPSVIKKPIGMIIAKEPQYENIPIVNKWTKLSRCLYIDRNNNRNALRTISEASMVISDGINIGAFPEGHLTDENDILDVFKDGLFRIATKSQCPVVPIVIEGSEKSYITDKSRIPIVNDAEIHVYILEPIRTHVGIPRFKTSDLSEITRETILKKIKEHKKSANA